MRINKLVTGDINTSILIKIPFLYIIMLYLHFFIGLYYALTIICALLKVSKVVWTHELLVMVHEHFLFEDFVESLF